MHRSLIQPATRQPWRLVCQQLITGKWSPPVPPETLLPRRFIAFMLNSPKVGKSGSPKEEKGLGKSKERTVNKSLFKFDCNFILPGVTGDFYAIFCTATNAIKAYSLPCDV